MAILIPGITFVLIITSIAIAVLGLIIYKRGLTDTIKGSYIGVQKLIKKARKKTAESAKTE